MLFYKLYICLYFSFRPNVEREGFRWQKFSRTEAKP